MSVMFASNRSTNLPTGLLEFKAGKSKMEIGSTPERRKIVADKIKGLVFIKQTSDQLMHFCWKNRETGNIVDDLIIFPGDAEFRPVKECKNGRVFVLKFKSSDRRCFFWMQDVKTDKDDEICRKVNELLNNPPTRVAGRNAAERAVDQMAGMGMGVEDIGALPNLDQGQLMQLFNLIGGGQELDTASASALLPQLGLNRADMDTDQDNQRSEELPVSDANLSASTANPIKLSQLQNIISSISVPTQPTAVHLETVLTNEHISDTITNEQYEDRLLAHLPNEKPLEQNKDELRETVGTPQFRQAVEIFGHALQTGQLGPVLQQFGIDDADGDLEKFASKLTLVEGENKEGKTSSSSSGETTAKDGNFPMEEETQEEEPKAKRGKTDEDDDLD